MRVGFRSTLGLRIEGSKLTRRPALVSSRRFSYAQR